MGHARCARCSPPFVLTPLRPSPSSTPIFFFFLPFTQKHTVQPTQLGEFGFRYGLQLAQLFGVDFGFGLLKSTCTIDFVRV